MNISVAKDVMGMNSPRKRQSNDRTFESLSVKATDLKTHQKKVMNGKQFAAFGSSLPPTSTQPSASPRKKESITSASTKVATHAMQQLKPFAMTSKPAATSVKSPSQVISFDLEIEEKQSNEEQSLRLNPSTIMYHQSVVENLEEDAPSKMEPM